MKLHLPKLLCAAVMVAMGWAQADTDYPVVEKVGENTYINVGFSPVDGTNDNWIKTYTPSDGVLIVGSGDKVGAFKDDELTPENFHTSFVNGTGNSSNVSNTLKIEGDLIISGSGQVMLGGQSHTNIYTGLLAKNVTIDATATGSGTKVNGFYPNTNLHATRIYVDTLTVNGGSANIHNDQYGGNSWIGLGDGNAMNGAQKMAIITTKLTVSGDGYLNMGRVKKDNTYYVTGLGSGYWDDYKSLLIEQTGGTLNILGRTLATGGLKIEQSQGVMTLADNSVLNFSGNTKLRNEIRQYGSSDKTMTIGQITGSTAGIDVKQEGAGILNFTNGVTYKTSKTQSASTINQSGGGTINLSGDFTSADFTVTQTKGTINQKGTMDLVGTNDVGGTLVNSGTLTIADVNVIGTLVNDGTMTISGTATISGKFVNNKDSLTATTLNLVEGGVFENNGTWKMSSGDLNAGTIAGTGTYVYQSALKLTEGTLQLTLDDISDSSPSTFGGTLLNVNSYTLDVASDVNIALAMSGEVETLFRTMLANQADTPVEFTMLVAENVDDWENLDTAALAAQTEHSAYISGVSYSARDGKVYVSGKLIPEPTTATLSLMALAALAARRRRK